MSAREYLEREVRERAHHATAEEVRTTCSFARAERLIGREYHGRFLIELLQNAADAWRNDLRSLNGNHSRVSVLLAEGPALIVANQGAPMSAEVVIESLGHIGASTKSEGEAIGHKGIGFKSVLEITHAPEIYSGLQDDSLKLAVRFDPELAYSTITDSSPHWSELLSNVRSSDEHDELAAVPVLRFPHWVDELPTAVADLAAEGFDTVVLLPFNASPANRVELDEDSWLVTVRRALADISDQILVLLGCFSEVAIDDRLGGIREVIAPSWQIDSESGGSDYTRELVQVLRNGDLSSRWRLFRKSLPEIENLAGEIAVGIRIDGVSTPGALVPTADREVSAPFHLFFPTRIASGLPFLLHGYFEVDAARTGFYRGSESRNKSILHELAALTAEAVRDNAHSGDADVVTVVNLVAAAGDPEDPLARDFRADVLDRLDAFDWIPASPERDNLRTERPSGLFVCRPELTRHVAAVFPQTYVAMRVDLSLPDIRLSDAALDLIRLRQSKDGPDQWDIFGALLRPGSKPIWEGADADRGFLELLDLVAALEVEDRVTAGALISDLRGDPESRLLPTVSSNSGRTLLPVPDPSEGVSGRRSRLVMARARTTTGDVLVPPDELDLAFLPEGLLATEADIDRAKPLGVRPFTVDNILDRLNGIAGVESDDPEALLGFLWLLLHRERVSGFGTRRSAERSVIFDPSEWFWCRPGRALDVNDRLRQQRERYLSTVPLPCRDGEWRPAGSLAFGADWADWFESGAAGNPASPTVVQRATAYRALEAICPGSHTLVAPPEIFGSSGGGSSRRTTRSEWRCRRRHNG